jgi:hypothetical protein
VICGLQNSDRPTSYSLTLQETTNHDSPDKGQDGASLSGPGSSEVAEGVRLENVSAPETIGHDRPSSVHSQSLTEELAVGEKPIKHDRTR